MRENLSENAYRLLDHIWNNGGDPLIVGGFVRDSLLGLKPKDVDIEVHGVDLEHLTKVLTKSKFHVDQVGKSFGVLKVTVDGETFDVSVPRVEIKTGKSHRDFTVQMGASVSMHDAFARRDFTMNAIGLDPFTGRLIDPFDGLNDIQDKIIRHTSDAFAEDPLRVLRAVQFSARFGFTIAPETVELCKSLVDQFDTISKERVWVEWEKIWKSKYPDLALDALHQTGWIKHFPELGPYMDHWVLRDAYNTEYKDEKSQIIAVAGGLLYGQSGDSIVDFMNTIGAPLWLTKALRNIAYGKPTDIRSGTVEQVLRLMETAGVSFKQWHSVWSWHPYSTEGIAAVKKGIIIFQAKGDDPVVNPRLVTGKTLMDRGLKPSPVFKGILAECEGYQDLGVFDANTVDEWLDKNLPSILESN